MRLALLLLALSCATAPPPVEPFGPDTWTTHAFGTPSDARAEAIQRASLFCAGLGMRSLPVDPVLVWLPERGHSVTLVFRCFTVDPEEERT